MNVIRDNVQLNGHQNIKITSFGCMPETGGGFTPTLSSGGGLSSCRLSLIICNRL